MIKFYFSLKKILTMFYLPSLFTFLILYGFSLYLDKQNRVRRDYILLILAVICVLIIGLRNPAYWIDTWAYVESFKTSAKLENFSFVDTADIYTEKGYYLLCVIIRTFTDKAFVYLIVVGMLSMTFLFKSLRQYCFLPVLGLCIYIARYMLARDMNQMRAGLAISIVISFTYLLVSGNRKGEIKYILICWLTSYLHTSMLTAIPIVIMNHVKITRRWVYIGILLSFFVSSAFSHQIMDFISQSDTIRDMATDYVDKEGENSKAYAADLTNPMIYYQCIILFIYTFMEEKLAPMSKYYYVFRNGYFMSTVILIILCQYAVLSARVSTIFATFEIFMIPMIFKALPQMQRRLAYLVLLPPLVVFFMYNMH